MNIFDKIRIKRKIKKVCNIIRTLNPSDQEEVANNILFCLQVTRDKDFRVKERLFDMILEGCEGICQ